MTQSQWADHMGFSRQFICDVLAGRRPVTDRLARKLGYKRVVVFHRADSRAEGGNVK